MHDNHQELRSPSRRDFLTGVVAGAGAAGIAASVAATSREVSAHEAAASAGYRETSHIRAYYTLARM